MTDSKPWYQSVTIWGALLAAGSPLLRLVGYEGELDPAHTADLLATIGTGVGAAMALYGRLTANTTIGPKPDPRLP